MPSLPRLIGAAFAAVLALAAFNPPARAADAPVGAEMSLGNPKAKVTVVEYASVTCPHCAAFNAETFPAFKAKYVDTGKVRYVFREFPTEPAEVAVAGFLIARCAPADKYFTVIDTLFRGQETMYETRDAKPFLMNAGKAGGLDEAAVEACLKDAPKLAALNDRIKAAFDEKIGSTPTFLIGKTKLEGGQTLAALSAAIDPLLAAR